MDNLGCLVLNFKIKNWDNIVKDIVDEKDLYKPNDEDYGYNKYPHVTILFGLHDDKVDIDKIKNLLIPIDSLKKIKTKNISLFENDDFDVVKIDLKSKQLNNMNKILKDNFKYTNDYPDYHPHLTIAYVKKGEGKKYVGKFKEKIKAGEYAYSGPPPKYKKIKIKN